MNIETFFSQDILRENTRKERKNLLVCVIIGLMVSKGGFIPTEISTFGMKFDNSNKEFLLLSIAIALMYFLFTFLVSSATDLVKDKVDKWNTAKEGILLGPQKLDEGTFDRLNAHAQAFKKYSYLMYLVFFLRFVSEIKFPIALSIYTLEALL